MTRSAALLLVLALTFGACGGEGADPSSSADPSPTAFNEPFGGAEAYPVFASAEIVVGPNRFLVGLLNQDDAPIGSEEIEVSLDFYDLSRSETEAVFSSGTDFLETVPGAQGLYVAQVEFPHPGEWGAEVSIQGDGIDEKVKAGFTVKEKGTTPPLGAKAPRSKTPTARDRNDLAKISTDNDPDPRFYRLSVDDAVTSGNPSVIVFATPKFCTSQVCAPTLDTVKGVAPRFPGVNFVHVEVYTNLDDPSDLKVVPAIRQWGLPNEPWVFVVDGEGRIAAKYEGAVAPPELFRLLERLQG